MQFIVTICKRVIDELRTDAGGEEPERQQHIQNEHAQKSNSHMGGVAHVKNVTRTESAEHKKNQRHRRWERYVWVLEHHLDEHCKKNALSPWQRTQLMLLFFFMHGHEKRHLLACLLASLLLTYVPASLTALLTY